MGHDSSPSIYEAWQSTLAPFLVPAWVLSAWPVFMIVCASNRTPLKLLCMFALVSLADGLLGSCAFPLTHQYAFTLSQNNVLFYAGSSAYWLSGLLLGPVMEVWGTRKSCVVLSIAGAIGAAWCAQSVFLFALLGRCASATATAGLTTLVEYALYDEAHLRRGGMERDEHQLEKEKTALHEPTDGLGGGMLTMFHQLRPVTMWGSMILSQYVMIATPHVSTAPCWAASLCYVLVLGMAWKLLPTWTASEAFKLTSRMKGSTSSGSGGGVRTTLSEAERCLPGVMHMANCAPESPMAQRWVRHVLSTYIVSITTLLAPAQLARHLVDVLFGGLFFVMSLLWVPTLEMYDDSIPFGFIFQVFMMASFLGSTFSLPVWAVGGAEMALVVLLSVTARVLNTSRDYAIPVTIMLAGVAMHFVAGVAQTTGSLWRAEYPSAKAPLTFLFVVRALTGVAGWAFLNVVDGKYMEDVFVFEARWVYGLMWIEAVAVAQYIAKRATQHRESTINSGIVVGGGTGSTLNSSVRIFAGSATKEEDAIRETSFHNDMTPAVSLEMEGLSHSNGLGGGGGGGSPVRGEEPRFFKA